MKLFRQILHILLLLIIIFTVTILAVYLRQLKLSNQNLTSQVTQLQQSQAALVSQQLHFEATQESSASLAWMHAKAFIFDAQAVLEFRQNPAQTIELLKLAQAQITAIDGDKFILLNTALGDDIIMLSALPTVDETSIVEMLNNVSTQIDQIPAFAPAQNNISTTMPVPQPTSEWKKLWPKLKAEFKSLFVVERTSASFEGIVSVQDHALMQVYLKTLLQEAALATIGKNNALYQSSLQQAILFLNTYYLPRTPLVNTIITQLNSLVAINVAPTLPTQLKSMTLIESAQ
jgi:uncharacterized protein HemX